MSKKPAAASAALAAAASKSTKGKGNARAEAEARVRDDCVALIVDLLLAHIDQHINDKLIFPQTLAHAVGRTMAEMVNMVSIAHVQRMEDWLVHLEGSAPEEWDKPQEPLIPLIDSWARGVVPLKKMPNSEWPIDQPQQVAQAQENAKQPRRASTMALSLYHDPTPKRRSSDHGPKQGLRGSLRRFSDNLYSLDASRKVKFQEKTTDVEENLKDAPINRRSSTPPPLNISQGPKPERVRDMSNSTPDTGSRLESPKKEVKGAVKGNKATALPPTKKKVN